MTCWKCCNIEGYQRVGKVLIVIIASEFKVYESVLRFYMYEAHFFFNIARKVKKM